MSRAPDLDLHPYFRDPSKARAILDACIADNVRKGVTLVRVVHGKGSGDFKGLIHSHLQKHPDVEGFLLCDPLHGGSGATWVHIRAREIARVPAAESPRKPSWRWLAYVALIGLLYILKADWILLGLAIVMIIVYETSSRPDADST